MKTFGKYLLILLFISVFLGAGFYLMLNNLGSLLSPDHEGLRCRWLHSGVEIQTGGRVERIQFPNPFQFHRIPEKWEIKSGDYLVILHLTPRFKLTWKKLTAPSLKTRVKHSEI